MFPHSIGVPSANTKLLFFEATPFLNEGMQQLLNKWILDRQNSDGIARKCFRALANWYETNVPSSSKFTDPSILPHRDDVGNADVSIVVGITPRDKYRGAMLYVSTERGSGKLWTEHGKPSRKNCEGIDVSRGVCVILRNKVEHYVSALQSGSRGSLVFHMTAVWCSIKTKTSERFNLLPTSVWFIRKPWNQVVRVCAVVADLVSRDVVDGQCCPLHQVWRCYKHLVGFDECFDLSKAQLSRWKVGWIGGSKLIDVAIISNQVSNVGHFVGTVVVNHNKFWRLRGECGKKKKAQETIEDVAVHSTGVYHECHHAHDWRHG